MPTLKTILEARHSVHDKFISSLSDLQVLVRLMKEAGYRIVLTQGVYDMFHVGHGRYLADASSKGDVLIVGVDSDELTKSMKGPNRPFDTFEQRIEVLAMLSFVHIIARRDVNEHKYDLIKLVRPDVLVMSQTTRSFGDEDKDALKEFCGEIVHLEARAATSTTAKLRLLKIDGARELADKLKGRVEAFASEVIGVLEESLNGEGDG